MSPVGDNVTMEKSFGERLQVTEDFLLKWSLVSFIDNQLYILRI